MIRGRGVRLAWVALVSVTGVLGALGCGETERDESHEGTGTTAEGGSAACAIAGPTGCVAEGGSSGAGGNSGERHCPSETEVEAPGTSAGCTVSIRTVDPMFTCGESDCAVMKALDLSCETLPSSPWLSATNEGAVLLAVTHAADTGDAVARLVRFSGDSTSVEDVPELADPTLPLPAYSILNAALALDSNGSPWLFAGRAAPITALREIAGGWMRSHILPTVTPLATALLTDARMVDDTLGYLTYTSQTDAYAPHLVTWDGSCWTDQSVGERSSPAGLVLAVDQAMQPWTAWFDESLYLRHPDGETEEVQRNLGTNDDRFTGFHPPLRLLPAGPDAAAAPALIAARVDQGLALFSEHQAVDTGWHSTLLPETDTITSDCPFGNPMPASGEDQAIVSLASTRA